MKIKLYALVAIAAGFAFTVVSNPAMAGFIAPDGNEWEFRGDYGSWDSHSTTAAADTGWNWASLGDWAASGLDGSSLSLADGTQLAGTCDLVRQCDGWFSDRAPMRDPGSDPRDPLAIVDAPFARDEWRFNRTTGSALWLLHPAFESNANRLRISYRVPGVTAVPEPTVLGLMLLGFAGLVGVRRRSPMI